MAKKILFFDTRLPLSFGRDLFENMKKQYSDIEYVNLRDFGQRKFYKLKNQWFRFVNKKFKNTPSVILPEFSKKKFSKILKEKKPDIFIIFGFFHQYIDAETMAQLKKEIGFSLILYDTDTANMFFSKKRLSDFINQELKCYDLIFSFSKVIAQYFTQLGFSTHFLPYGFDYPSNIAALNKTRDVLFVCGTDIRRAIYLELINDFNVEIYGERWKKWSNFISPALMKKVNCEDIWGDKLYTIMNQSKIILNISRHEWHTIDSGVNLRVFEALAAKQFLLTEYIPELEDLFEIGKDLEVFRSIEELRGKIKYYLKHDQEREAIASHGHQTVIKKYSMEKCAKNFLSHILRVGEC